LWQNNNNNNDGLTSTAESMMTPSEAMIMT